MATERCKQNGEKLPHEKLTMHGARASATVKSAKRQNSQPVKKAERETRAAQPQN
jgi:hypothetical protein